MFLTIYQSNDYLIVFPLFVPLNRTKLDYMSLENFNFPTFPPQDDIIIQLYSLQTS